MLPRDTSSDAGSSDLAVQRGRHPDELPDPGRRCTWRWPRRQARTAWFPQAHRRAPGLPACRGPRWPPAGAQRAGRGLVTGDAHAGGSARSAGVVAGGGHAARFRCR
ncbi:hypothetical protein G6F40_015364 [Rhizopus arrhizus]|nr:hypothetical protein G6F40_015364 [Rhizopus arrhizus]